jgi:hypothetical protein
MKNKDLETRLQSLNIPDAPPAGHHQRQLKFALVNAKKSARTSLWLLSVPFVMLSGAVLDSVWNISVPPWSLLKAYGHLWPLWIRMSIFVTTVMILPLIALIINILAVLWVNYDKEQKVLNIAIRMKTVNIIIIAVAGILAFLFIGHSIADSIAGHE